VNQRAYARGECSITVPREAIEHFLCKLKLVRAIATRYDKAARNDLAAVYLAGTAILLN
jgi:transposase